MQGVCALTLPNVAKKDKFKAALNLPVGHHRHLEPAVPLTSFKRSPGPLPPPLAKVSSIIIQGDGVCGNSAREPYCDSCRKPSGHSQETKPTSQVKNLTYLRICKNSKLRRGRYRQVPSLPSVHTFIAHPKPCVLWKLKGKKELPLFSLSNSEPVLTVPSLTTGGRKAQVD
jgi:hypothetical protein